MAERGFSTSAVAAATGFSRRQLDYWDRREVVVPSLQRAQGSGSRKLYSTDDLTALLFIRKLKRCGWSTQKILKAVVILREVMNDPNPLRSAVLINGKGAILAVYKTGRGERVVFDTLGRQQVLEIVLDTLFEETRSLLLNVDT